MLLLKGLEQDHSDFYNGLQVSDSKLVPSVGHISALFSGDKLMSFVHPRSGDRLEIRRLLSDCSIIEALNDERLLTLCRLKVRIRQARIVYIGAVPLILVAYLGVALF